MSFHPNRRGQPCALIVAVSLLAGAVQANTPLEELAVSGRTTDRIGIAGSASEGSVSGADLSVRPMLKVAELLEAMPGMVAVQHSGSGKANQYFLRGFNLDHGTDYTARVDGVPMNLRSHGHGQGYLDVNGLIAESVQRIDYHKGPYSPDSGDFSLAGSSAIHTINRLEESFMSVDAGDYGWRRLSAGHSMELGSNTLTLIAESKQYDGPWDQEEDLHHHSLWGKYLFDTAFGQVSWTLSLYSARWKPTEQIPERIIGSAVCRDAYCTPDSTAEGSTDRVVSSIQLQGNDWQLSLYGQHYDWWMESNPTYDFQIRQFDRRSVMGGDYRYMLLDDGRVEVLAGVDGRYDHISSVGLDQQARGRFVAHISSNRILEHSVGALVDARWQMTETLRLLGGFRGDYYLFDVDARDDNSFSGNDHDSAFSPTLGLAWSVFDALEMYGNWGKGFHSNDARGVVNDSDPVPGLSQGEGHEIGSRLQWGDLYITAAYWWLRQDRELIFVGDSNSVEPKGSSHREGYEVSLFWQPLSNLSIDASYAHSRARYDDGSEGSHVENAIESAAQLGVSIQHHAWEFNARVRHLGAYSLTADNLHRSEPLTTVNMRTGYRWRKVLLYGEVINVFDSDDKDITYYYPAYIAGFDAPGQTSEEIDCDSVSCTMSRVTEPRTLRVGLRYAF